MAPHSENPPGHAAACGFYRYHCARDGIIWPLQNPALAAYSHYTRVSLAPSAYRTVRGLAPGKAPPSAGPCRLPPGPAAEVQPRKTNRPKPKPGEGQVHPTARSKLPIPPRGQRNSMPDSPQSTAVLHFGKGAISTASYRFFPIRLAVPQSSHNQPGFNSRRLLSDRSALSNYSMNPN